VPPTFSWQPKPVPPPLLDPLLLDPLLLPLELLPLLLEPLELLPPPPDVPELQATAPTTAQVPSNVTIALSLFMAPRSPLA
jgi:hypothetical protein